MRRLLLLALLGTAFAAPQSQTAELHKDCARRDAGTGLYVNGYIAGVYATYSMGAPLNVPANTTQGDMKDAVCRYIDLHPEIWSLRYPQGVVLALDALYARPNPFPNTPVK